VAHQITFAALGCALIWFAPEAMCYFSKGARLQALELAPNHAFNRHGRLTWFR
jgi:hypothetical protein